MIGLVTNIQLRGRPNELTAFGAYPRKMHGDVSAVNDQHGEIGQFS
jgi:hypothetical protein